LSSIEQCRSVCSQDRLPSSATALSSSAPSLPSSSLILYTLHRYLLLPPACRPPLFTMHNPTVHLPLSLVPSLAIPLLHTPQPSFD
jgi:hypothetical protein